MTKPFHISDILSVSTGFLVSTRHIEGVYDVLNHMTGDQLFTHQLPRAGEECRPWLFRQHPQLEEVDTDSLELDLLADAVVKADREHDEAKQAWREAAAEYHASGHAETAKTKMHQKNAEVESARERSKAVREEVISRWLCKQIVLFDEFLPVDSIPADDHARRDAVEELESMVGKDKVIVVKP